MANKPNNQIIELTDNLGQTHQLSIRPVSFHTSYTANGAVELPSMPAWAVQAENGNFTVAEELIIRDIISEFSSTMADRVMAYTSPLRVSDTVYPGFFWLDDQGLITVNERWAKDRALDSDGDNAFIIWTKDRNAAYFVKYPLTQQVPKLYLQQEKQPDTWLDYDETLECWDEPRPLTEDQIRQGFLKVHASGDIGRKTNAWDARELQQAYQARMSYHETCKHLLSDIGRFYELEGILKSSRAGLGAKAMAAIQTEHSSSWIIDDRCRWRLQGKPGTVDDSVLRSILSTDWKEEARLEDTLKGLSFKQINTNRPTKPRKEVVRRVYEQVDHLKRNFTQRLEYLRVIEWEDMKVIDPALPPAQILRCYYRKGFGFTAHPVALHDERRESSMYQEWILPPVATIKDGQVFWTKAQAMLESEISCMRTRIKKEGLWPQSHGSIESHPKKAAELQQCLQRFVGKYGLPSLKSNDFMTCGKQVAQRAMTVIYSTNIPEKMYDEVYFLRRWFDTTHQSILHSKISTAQAVIDKVNSDLKRHGLNGGQLSDFAVQNGPDQIRAACKLKIEKQQQIIDACQASFNYTAGILGGIKDSDKNYRRYLLADKQTLIPCYAGNPSLNPPMRRCSAKRVGEIHSQVAQSVVLGMTAGHNPGKPQSAWKPRKARIFIYGDGTRGQLYAFPSGQKLQDIPGVFLQQVNDRPDEERGITVGRVYRTISGEERVSYTSEARPTIGCGKLVSIHGFKMYCGVEANQLVTCPPGESGVEIDFAVSQWELMSQTFVDDEGREWKGKQCLEAWLESGHAYTASVVWDGRLVTGRVVEITLMRTTTASENTRPETRVRRVSGIAKHAVRAALMSTVADYGDVDTHDWLNWDNRSLALADEPRLKPRNFDYLLTLQTAGRIIGSRNGSCAAPKQSVVIEEVASRVEMEVAAGDESVDQSTLKELFDETKVEITNPDPVLS